MCYLINSDTHDSVPGTICSTIFKTIGDNAVCNTILCYHITSDAYSVPDTSMPIQVS